MSGMSGGNFKVLKQNMKFLLNNNDFVQGKYNFNICRRKTICAPIEGLKISIDY